MFPLTEEHLPLHVPRETFGVPLPGQVEVTTAEKPLLPRVCFLNQSETELIQIQTDRFIHNWRKAGNVPAPYPRYEGVRAKFRDEVSRFQQFLSDEKLGQVVVNQCEGTYVNHIEPCGLAQARTD